MRLKNYIVLAVAVSMVANLLAGPVLFSPIEGDVNNDGQLNVLDAQVMVVQVVGNAARLANADLNHDGRIDILDLQATLARMKDARSGDPVPAEQRVPRGIATHTDRFWLKLTPVILAVLTEDGAPAAFPISSAKQDVTFLTPVTERYLFTLTPHAPPALS